MPYEGRRVFDYARTYFELGRDRSLSKVSQSMHVSVARLRVLSVKWSWVIRARAWDENEYRRELEEQAQTRKDFREREARLGDLLITSGFKALMGDGVSQPATPTFADGVRAISEGLKVKRLNLGLPTDVNQLQATHLHANVTESAEVLLDAELQERAHELLRLVAQKRVGQAGQVALPPAETVGTESDPETTGQR